MTTSEFETDRRSLIGGTLGALTIAAMSRAAAAPAAKTLSTIRKALLPARQLRHCPAPVTASSAPPFSTCPLE